MQHKQRLFGLKIIPVIIVAVIVAIGALMLVDVPAPQKPIEKELDAKAFLDKK